MAAITIDDLDWFDSDWCYELTAEGSETIQGGRLPSEGGSGSWRPPRPPLFINPLPPPTIPIGPTLGLPLGKPTFP